MLCSILYTMLCKMIRNVLRDKNPSSLPSFPVPNLPACSASLFNNYLAALLSPLAGPIGGHGGAVGGAWRRSAGFDSSSGPVVLGWQLGVPGQHLARNVVYASFLVVLYAGFEASPWRLCTRRQSWYRHWDPESAGRATLQGSSPGRGT
jgi:hypothetical protein